MDGWFLTLRAAQQQHECEQNKLHVGRWCEADGAHTRFYLLQRFRLETVLECCCRLFSPETKERLQKCN